MSLDGLSKQFEDLVDRARAALDREITGAKKIVAAANAEKNSAQAVLADLEAQCDRANPISP
jgi:hypothetical protein